jgi:dolichyl-phosphate-mannose--protein O-mannosyl transferase
MGMFQIHFMILQSSGDGDGFMSSEFQHTLSGRAMADTFAGGYKTTFSLVFLLSASIIRYWSRLSG